MGQHEGIETVIQRPVSRRTVLQGTAVAGAAAFLAACAGGTGGSPAASGESPAASAGGGTGELTGPLNWANWPGYMDWAEDGTTAPTLTEYTDKTGVDVNYSEEIESNEDFVATISPQLESGADTGWDLVTLTDYMAARLIDRGWLEEIDAAAVPTAAANIKGDYTGRSWDPAQTYHYPYQTFADGVGYNRVSTGMDLTSTADMFLPQFATKTTLINAYQDTFSQVGLMLRDQGKISNLPADFTNEDGDTIFAFLKPFVDDGHVRAFTGNEYIQDFNSGDTWVAIVWSGDLANSAGPDDRFVYPSEGLVASTDNLLIPKGAAHKAAALALIDHVFDVAVAARLSAGIKYISPVAGADEAIKEIDAALAENPLIFPPPEVVTMTHVYPAYDDEKDAYFQDLIDQLMGA